MFGYRLDIKDTLKRIASVGQLIDLNESSNYATIANALLSMERARLDRAVEATKKTLGDWAGAELDNWWGTILSIERLPGVETTEEFIGDGTYISRIKRFMEAGSKGISLEAVRMAAEAGSGVPFRVNKAEQRIILTPLEEIDAAQKAGALRAVYRLAPARGIVEIGSAESYVSTKFNNVWSDSTYVGEDPTRVRLNGPHWDSPNYMIVATANKWGTAPEGSLAPGTGLPNLLFKGGAWHVPNLGFGQTATLNIGTEVTETINRVSFVLGQGNWRIEGFVEDQPVFTEEATSFRWFKFDKVFEFHTGAIVTLKFTNISQDLNGLFIKGAYIGARVNQDNRLTWLTLGGKEGANAREEVIIADAKDMGAGKEWICQPAPDPSFTRDFYATVGGSPRQISAIGMKTRTPGALFNIAYSMDNLDRDEDYPKLTWIQIPHYYKAKNGRVDVEPFKARHIKFTFTNLRPMLLKEYQNEPEA